MRVYTVKNLSSEWIMSLRRCSSSNVAWSTIKNRTRMASGGAGAPSALGFHQGGTYWRDSRLARQLNTHRRLISVDDGDDAAEVINY